MKRLGVALILLFAFLGLSDSIYIAQNEANNSPLICNVQNLSGCNIVQASQYSHVFGISLAEYGVAFYAFIFVIAALELLVFDRFLRRVLQGAAIVGVIASAYFTFLEIFVIHALCIYCLVSAFIALLVLIFASLIEPVRNLKKP